MHVKTTLCFYGLTPTPLDHKVSNPEYERKHYRKASSLARQTSSNLSTIRATFLLPASEVPWRLRGVGIAAAPKGAWPWLRRGRGRSGWPGWPPDGRRGSGVADRPLRPRSQGGSCSRGRRECVRDHFNVQSFSQKIRKAFDGLWYRDKCHWDYDLQQLW